MSQIPPILNITEEDVKKLLACSTHIGDKNLSEAMGRYVFKRTEAGVHLIDLRTTWEKLQLAARIIVAIENPKDICVIALAGQASSAYAQRAVLKFAHYIGARAIAGRYVPGTFTNQAQSVYWEPRLVLVTDVRKDHQPVVEASYANIPVMAFANTNATLRGIDLAIPCNNEGKYSIALMYWLLAREVLRLRGTIPRDREWDVLVDMFVYRDPEEQEKQEETQTSAYTGGANAWESTGGAEAGVGGEYGDADGEGDGDNADWGESSGAGGAARTAGGDWGATQWGDDAAGEGEGTWN